MTQKRLLALLAHPDDESFGPGGTFSRYAAEGVDVHICIATDGAAGSIAEGYEHTRDRLVEVRTEELDNAIKILGATLHKLNYRDSGYIKDPANDHPDAFINCDEAEAVKRVVKLIREIRPQVFITHDETGGYFHPDHIHCWKIGTAAFAAAGDSQQYPELNLPPYAPQKMYFTAFSTRWVKIFSWIMRLRGQDPTKGGRNQDIDFTHLGMPTKKLHALIDYRDYWDQKNEASAQHLSQGGGTGFNRFLPIWLQKHIFGYDTFIRAYPPTPDGFREKDLFADTTLD